MGSLMITLGHNSSALFYRNGIRPVGFEQERFDKVKSSSAFPKDAILEIMKHEDITGSKLYISHWFDHYDPEQFPTKYYDHKFMDGLISTYKLDIQLLTPDFTHHDAHMYSSMAFAGRFVNETTHYIVADGFGNNQEVLSIYVQSPGGDEPELMHRVYGYVNSIGLLYQFATEFCSMKPNQDEWKFLGYEVNDAISDKEKAILFDMAAIASSSYMEVGAMVDTDARASVDTIINFDELNAAKESIFGILEGVLSKIDLDNRDGLYELKKRVVVGYFIQAFVESVFSRIIDKFEIKNVRLSGGCFYNVKLNNHIMNKIDGNISIIPVAGDQGAAIGMHYKQSTEFEFYDMCWGRRQIDVQIGQDNLHVCYTFEDYVDTVVKLIKEDMIVNTFNGDMEFGPRALCNTTTLAKPTTKNLKYINEINGRNTVMPMAPVMLDRNANAFFSSLDSVIGSNKFMIITHQVCEEVSDESKYDGILHPYPHPNLGKKSARPQVITKYDLRPIRCILDDVNDLCLINTSFNTHGSPIPFSSDDALVEFNKQRRKDVENRVHLVILQR